MKILRRLNFNFDIFSCQEWMMEMNKGSSFFVKPLGKLIWAIKYPTVRSPQNEFNAIFFRKVKTFSFGNGYFLAMLSYIVVCQRHQSVFSWDLWFVIIVTNLFCIGPWSCINLMWIKRSWLANIYSLRHISGSSPRSLFLKSSGTTEPLLGNIIHTCSKPLKAMLHIRMVVTYRSNTNKYLVIN